MTPYPLPSCLVHIFKGILFYYLTTLVTLLGGIFGTGFVKEAPTQGRIFDGDSCPFYVNWDGQWYKNIAQRGYFYAVGDFSSVNFFPAYPLLARGLSAATGLDLDVALLLVSNLCLLATFILLARYCEVRHITSGLDTSSYVLLSLGLAPPSFFFRMAYSESLLLLLTILVLFGMRQRWPLIVLAVITGFATAVRPVGVALMPALIYHLWTRYPKPQAFLVRLVGLLPVALWGLIGYMCYLAVVFGDALVFVKSHDSWNLHPNASIVNKIQGLLTLQPLWSRFVSTSPSYWVNIDHHYQPLFSLYLANPLYFLFAVGLVMAGAYRRWLTVSETLVSVGLLGLPLAFKCYETDMMGFARYAAAVLPAYFVLARVLHRVPAPIASGLLAISGTLMAIYTALFAKWYFLI